MMSKPLSVVLAGATVVGAIAIGAHQMRGTISDAPAGDRSAPAVPAAPRVSHSIAQKGAQQSNGGSHANPRPQHDQGIADGTKGGPTRTRISSGHRQDRVKNGTYVTMIAGFYTGSGSADVKDDKVSIKADVLTADGRHGQFLASNLMFDGPYFYGVGTILGETVEVNGRMDAARASRLTATFALPDGRAARVVGKLPAALDAGDENWDEDVPGTRIPR